MMVKLLPHGRKLTGDTPELQSTHEGQAHFGGTGPTGKTCRECEFWQQTGYARGMWQELKPGPCGKFRQLTGRNGADVPHHADACRYFEQGTKSPVVMLGKQA